MDEAGCADESDICACFAVTGGRLRKLLLVGDHAQLPPITKVDLGGYGRSCLERAAEGASVAMLKEQFRMAPMIRELVSAASYRRARIRANTLVDERCASAQPR